MHSPYQLSWREGGGCSFPRQGWVAGLVTAFPLPLMGLIGEGKGKPLQLSCLENSVDRGAWQATVTGLSDLPPSPHITALSPPHTVGTPAPLNKGPGVCVLSHSVRSDSFHPMDCSPPGSSAHGILRARILDGLQCPPSGDLPNPGI